MKRNAKTVMIALFVSFLALGAAVAGMGHKMDVESMTGEVTAVNSDSGTFTVKPADPDAQPMTFHTDGATEYQQNGEKSGEGALSIGAKVTVRYESKDGHLVALTVHIA
jgi:hypothetical protein